VKGKSPQGPRATAQIQKYLLCFAAQLTSCSPPAAAASRLTSSMLKHVSLLCPRRKPTVETCAENTAKILPQASPTPGHCPRSVCVSGPGLLAVFIFIHFCRLTREYLLCRCLAWEKLHLLGPNIEATAFPVGNNYPESGLVKPPRRDTRAFSQAGMFGGKAPLRLAAQKSRPNTPLAPMLNTPA
jgi:hypothetical protein